jgi:hypothetical protein
MKKAKFTLGLVLSMLFMGANVMNAEEVDISKPHNGGIDISLSVKASDFYGTSGVTLKQIAEDPNGPYHYVFDTTLWDLSADTLEKNFGLETRRNAWLYGSKTKGLPDFLLNENRGTQGYHNYYYDAPEFNPAPTTPTFGGNLAGLFYYRVVSKTALRNELTVDLKYINGKELIPVIKRTITLGKWVYNSEYENGINELEKVSTIITNFLVADEAWFQPLMDRGTGVAKFVYKDDLLKILDTYPIIASIKYEVSLNDEVGTPGEGEYQPPVFADRTTMRGLSIDAEDGITTNLSAAKVDADNHSIIVYVPSQKDFVFTAYCDEAIEVTTDRSTDVDDRGVEIKSNGDGSYTVKIKRVQSNFKITIKKVVTPESGAGGDNDETGNETLSEYAVWGAGGTLYVKAAAPATLAIYNVTGQQIKQTIVNGNASFPMPKGLYIVQLNGKAYKVVL